MVALGLWSDQPTNARCVEAAWGAGARAPPRRGDDGVPARGGGAVRAHRHGRGRRARGGGEVEGQGARGGGARRQLRPEPGRVRGVRERRRRGEVEGAGSGGKRGCRGLKCDGAMRSMRAQTDLKKPSNIGALSGLSILLLLIGDSF